MATITLKPGAIALADLRRIARGGDTVALTDGWRGPVESSLAAVRARLAGGESLYGINTGFGRLAKTRISDGELATLQLYLMRSHAAGVGDPLADSTVRLVLVLKAASLARGFSGVRAVVVERLLALVNAGIHPVVPSQGSVGASGDLAPLAHLSLALIGEGRVRVKGREQDCGAAIAAAGIEPLELGPKEGLALLNGTQVSTALALEGLFAAEDLLAGSVIAGSMSVDAALGSRVPFDARIHNARGQPSQIAVAAAFRAVLGDSEIGHSHEDCDRVQDPY
jgi:histidine ammonia-lyase